MVIRKAGSGDGDAIAALLSKSFLEDTAVIRISIENNPRYSLSDMYVAENKDLSGGILGCLRISPFEVYSRGVKMQMAGIAAVAVQHEMRRQGLAESLMEDALRKMYEMNYPISMLFPFKHQFYKKFGYSFVGSVVQYEFSPENIADSDAVPSNGIHREKSHIRAFNKFDKAKLKKLFQQEIQTKGAFTMARKDNFWELVVFPKFRDAYVYDDGEVKGYIAFELYKEQSSQGGLAGDTILNIKEFMGLDASVHRGLWRFIRSLGDQVARVKFLAPADYPFHLFLKEPRESDFRRLFFEYKSLATHASGFMLRVINVPEALRSLRHKIETPSDFVVKVLDPQIPSNSRSFSLHLHTGEVHVEETNRAAQFESNIEVFSQVYSGFLRPSDALWFGYAKGDGNVGSKLDELFRAPAPFIYQYDIF